MKMKLPSTVAACICLGGFAFADDYEVYYPGRHPYYFSTDLDKWQAWENYQAAQRAMRAQQDAIEQAIEDQRFAIDQQRRHQQELDAQIQAQRAQIEALEDAAE